MLFRSLLGASVFALTYSYIMSEKRGELEDKVEAIAQLAVTAYDDPSLLHSWDQTRREMKDILTVAEKMSGTDFIIILPGLNQFITTDQTLETLELPLPEEINGRLVRGEVYAGVTDLGIYEKPRFVVALPARKAESGSVVGPIMARAEPNAMTEMWGAFMGIFGMTAITVLLIAFVASATTAMQQTKPIRDMAAAARRFADGNFDARVHNTGRDDETGELIDAFNAMADSLQKTEQQRREFIANVSHELKTPMTTIAGFAEGILDGTIPPERERESLEIVVSETRRLSRLVRRMLDLSRLNALAESTVTAQETFDLTEVMSRVLISLETKITDRQLDVEVQMPEDKLMVWGDPDSITQVCYNLLDNAAKFAAPGTAITVQRSEERRVGKECRL